MYVNESNSQLRAAHLILEYTPISRAFQASKSVIKAKDHRFHRISVAYKGFVVPEGFPLPKNTVFPEPFPVATLSVGAPSPSPTLQEREEEQEERGFVDLTESVDNFEVFDQPSSPKSLPKEMGIQRKPQKSLMELIENQQAKGDLGSLFNPNFHLPHRSFLSVLLNQPVPLGLNRWTLRGGESRRAKM